MQRTWQNDRNKLTFIILENQGMSITSNDVDYMAGDVNLFMHDRDDPFNAEIEIMIAEPRYRRKGFAEEALLLMMKIGIAELSIHRFFAKISEDNQPSLSLFRKLVYFMLLFFSLFFWDPLFIIHMFLFLITVLFMILPL